jgi:hypothetical protein
MKILMSLFLILSTTLDLGQNLSEIRSYYQKAAEEKTAAQKLVDLSRGGNLEDPLLYGYKGAAHMMMAKHVGNPFKKLSYFNTGKDIFSKAIEAAPKNVELRFLRFSVQAEAPAFLNYKQNLEEDKNILLAQTANLGDAELKQIILSYLLSSKELSDSEKEKL